MDNPSRRNISSTYKNYQIGIGGPCSIFDPPVSFWCAHDGASAGADAVAGVNGFTPSGVEIPADAGVHAWADPVGDGAEAFVWRSGHWNNWMFEVGGRSANNVTFGKGGFQGTRPGGAEEYYFSHVREELDAPDEFFLDRRAGKLLYFYNTTTTAPPPPSGFAITWVRSLLLLNGTKTEPVVNVTVSGVGFRDARATYMDPHGVPSGGDWGLQRSGAIMLDGASLPPPPF